MSRALATFPLLAQLRPADASRLAAHLEHRDLPAGEVLFREGDPADALWLIEAGEVELTSRGVDGSGRCGPGRALGALALVDEGVREVTARTASACRLLCLSRAAFAELVASAPDVACALALALARESAASLREALDALRGRDLGGPRGDRRGPVVG